MKISEGIPRTSRTLNSVKLGWGYLWRDCIQNFFCGAVADKHVSVRRNGSLSKLGEFGNLTQALRWGCRVLFLTANFKHLTSEWSHPSQYLP